MNEALPFHLASIGEDEIESVVETLRSGWLTTGARVRQFEERFAERVGAEFGVALNSCTAALHLALEAVGLEEGDEVIVPTMTFAATAEVVTYFKARPVLVDVRPDTLNLDAEGVEAAITGRTRAVIPVHFAGHPCEMDPILEVARRHGLAVVEDAAHAFPARYRGREIGTIGDITCFSFYPTKPITTGEGGMATTQNRAWSDRIRSMSLHGLSRDAWNRYGARGSWRYDIAEAGYKYNMTDVAAAIGLPQLDKADALWARRKDLAARYRAGLQGIPGLELPVVAEDVDPAWHLFVVRVDPQALPGGRDELVERLAADGIGTSVHFIPLHLHEYYRKTLGVRPEDLPHATEAFERILSLPLYPAMRDHDIDRVVDVVRKHLQPQSMQPAADVAATRSATR